MSETISLTLGAILPPIIDLITRKITNSKLRFWVSILICILVGIIINLKSLNFEDVLASAGLIITSAQIVYKTYWSNSSIRSPQNKE